MVTYGWYPVDDCNVAETIVNGEVTECKEAAYFDAGDDIIQIFYLEDGINYICFDRYFEGDDSVASIEFMGEEITDVILEEGCFDRIRAKQVNIPDTTKWSPCRREDYESDSCFEFLPVSADNMDNFIGIVFGYSIWHFMELLKQVKQHLETLIEKIDSLDFCPITWDDSYLLLHELETAEAEIDKLSEQLYPILSDDSFCNDTQNKDLVMNIKEADNCLIEFSSHFRRIYSVLEEEGPKEWYDEDYEFLSAQLKNAKQHLSKDSTCFQ